MTGVAPPRPAWAPAGHEPDQLVARTTALPARAALGGVDLAAVAGDHGLLFERDGAGLACRGVALRLDLLDGLNGAGGVEQVSAALGRIEARDDVGRPGCGPLALGALPFDPGSPASLVVPAMAVGVDVDGTAWCTTVAPAGQGRPGPSLEALAGGGSSWPPDQFSLRSSRTHHDWCESVQTAIDAVRDGRLEKVVLAREVVVEANRPFLTADVVGRLRALYPSCTTFSMDGFVGASPELLVSRRGSAVRSHPLAGTVARSGDPDVDAALGERLMASAKERCEHQMVVAAVVDQLEPLCRALDVPPSPSIVPLRNVTHLGTPIRGTLHHREPSQNGDRRSPWPTALELVARLHPTPAVAGTPTDRALELISEVEGLDRSRYAGPVGWVDSRGDGDWVVGIRSATLEGTTARLTAGVGIVADSSPRAELAETQLKLQALLAAVVRP